MVAATLGVGQVVSTPLWVFAFFVHTWLMVSIFIDVFRSHDLSGLAKVVGWCSSSSCQSSASSPTYRPCG